ncbi:flavocytochrome c [Shewanella xiamenensis]|uniref:Fumarate reductase n=1 Tax=Shewanella xiamenensis TaxID=332186 RepID=A0ABT6U6T3_9GAMM|nr:flavocytochrome c [Shewanella xiamenensis]MDI5830168.1 flavocytochrome c [Shewanella xiamenensis]
MFNTKLLPLAISAFFISTFSFGQTLSEFHIDNGNNCQSCHTKPIKVDDAESYENKSCESCHGTMDKLATKSKTKLSPHHSHLIDVSCTSCHSGHKQPVFVCQTCHDSFKNEFKIPFSDDKPILDSYQFPKVTQEMIDTALAKAPVEQHQVVVIGAGAAGHAAAISARQHGVADVVILEKQPYIGGNSMLAAGGMSAAETITQALKNYPDSKALWYEDTMKGGHNINNPNLVKILTENGSAGIDWLQAMGADLTSASSAGGHNAERLHRPTGGAKSGPEIVNTLKETAKKLGIETRTNSKVIQLVQDKQGVVTGVLVQGKHSKLHILGAKAVIIASGGFARNNELVAKYRPDLKGVDATNNPGNVGDALTFAPKAGAEVVDIKEIQAFPTAAAGKMVISGTARGAGAIMLNNDGDRFCDEMGPRDKVSECIWAQEGKDAWLVFDETVLDRLGQLRGMLDLGIIFKGNSADEIAKATKMNAQKFDHAIKRYNDFKMKGKDADFGRKNMADDLQYPIYAVKIKPAVHHTMGGLKINAKTEVIDRNGLPIKGLFAAGEVTGGVHGANRLAGNAIADTIVFGRIAGEQVANSIK